MDAEGRETVLAEGWPPISKELAAYLEAMFFPARVLFATDDVDEFRHYSGALELVTHLLSVFQAQQNPSAIQSPDDGADSADENPS